MLLSPFTPSYLDTYSLSVSLLWCKALFIGINFLVLWSIFLCFSVVHFRMIPSCWQGVQPRYLYFNEISAAEIGIEKFSCSYEVPYSFFYLCFFHKVRFKYSQIIEFFSFLRAFWFFLGLVVPSFRYWSFSVFHHKHGTIFIPYSIPTSRSCVLIICIIVSNSFSFLQTTWYRPRWLIFRVILQIFLPPLHFLRILMSGITNSNGERVSPWNISLDFHLS